MSRALVQFNDYVSLAVMLLMLLALIGGQSGAVGMAANAATTGAGNAAITVPFSLEIDGHIGDQAVKVGLAVAGELGQFRGEDE